MWEEFKKFAAKGNVLDLAVGVIIGGAFGKIVTSLVNDLIMPVVSGLTGKIDLTSMFYALDGVRYNTLEEAKAAGAVVISYGNFLTAVVDFFIIAFALFVLVKQINKLSSLKTVDEGPKAPAPPTTKTCPFCQSKISVKATRCPHCTSHLATVKAE